MGKTILLADDSKTIQHAVGLTFESTEFRVVLVGDGQSALDQVGSIQPDVVIADISMPGMGGYDLCAALKTNAATNGIPVLLLASAFDPFDEQRAEAAQANGHIQKPFDTQSLIALVTDVTGGVAQSNEPLSFAAALRKRQAEEAAPAPAAERPAPPSPSYNPPAPTPPEPASPPMPSFQAPAPSYQPPAPAYAPPQPSYSAPAAISDLAPPEPPSSPFGAPQYEPAGPSDDVLIEEEIIEDIEVYDDAEELPRGPTLEPPTPPVASSAPRSNVDVWALDDSPTGDAQRDEDTSLDELPIDDAMAIDDIAIDEQPIDMTPVPISSPAHAAPIAAMADAAAGPVADAAAAVVPGLPREDLLRLAREVIESIAWEVVPDLAETIIRAELDRLVREEM